MGIKQKLEKALHDVPESKLEEHSILKQLTDVVSVRQDYGLPSAVILRSRMNTTSIAAFLHNYLGINVQSVKFLPYAGPSREMTYQVELCG